jgi:hypothetical protein
MVAWRCAHPSPNSSAEQGSQLDLTGPLTPLFGSSWGGLFLGRFGVPGVFRSGFCSASSLGDRTSLYRRLRVLVAGSSRLP